jgi:hypothetical protein
MRLAHSLIKNISCAPPFMSFELEKHADKARKRARKR